ncbi:MAG: adenosylcobinamide-phosphate synthase CbiB [Candidatus Accumulibacter sp.]|jgi:adenosylcobinamide-phosphate synthase|nr:adenosylcobinamide-phosphate synthase CbiB [Accumulibacter sp.]
MSFSFSELASVIPSSLHLPLAAVAGVALDRLLGETSRWHPLAGFGGLAEIIERACNRGAWRRTSGVCAWVLAVAPWTALAAWGGGEGLTAWLLDAALLYLALGHRSLGEHAGCVAGDLAAADLAAAREHVGRIVSRNTAELDASGVAGACVESTLENGNDAVFGALFWFALLGGAGAVLFRLANTLDAMWGYKTERFLRFGWAAARIDDLLNYLPARLTAASYALFGETRAALSCWRRQAPAWESPNAGPVMAAGAGSLGLVLGGPAVYHGKIEQRPALGEGRKPDAGDIARALSLVRRGILLWLAVFLAVGAAVGTLDA